MFKTKNAVRFKSFFLFFIVLNVSIMSRVFFVVSVILKRNFIFYIC